MAKTLRALTALVVLVLGVSMAVLAQEKGKISGRITDKDTREAIPAANVTIEGTTFGGSSNAKGEYFIINLPPKTYTLVVSVIGYSKVRVENVGVSTGNTTIQNIELSSKELSTTEIVIVAERPVIQQDVSTSQDVATGAQIAALPAVTDVREFVGLQAGVEGLSVRGGSIDETAVMIDGSVAVEPTTNQPYTSIPLSAVAEVSVIKGGFNAEYGNIRSGLINITTKDGDKDRYHLTMDFRIAPDHQKHFGPSMFSPDNYYMRPYFDPEVAFTGTQNWPEYIRLQYAEGFQGWNKWVQENSQWGLTPKQAQQVFMWTHDITSYPAWGIEGAEALGQVTRVEGTKPDWNGEASISGPIPFVSSFLGDATFFGSFKGNKTYYAVPFSRLGDWQQDYQLKVISHPTNAIKVAVQGIYSDHRGTNYQLGDGVDGSFMGESSSLYQANNRNSYYYWESSFSPLDLYRTMLSFDIDHVLSQSTFYTFKVSWGRDSYKSEGYLNVRDTTTLITLGNLRLNQIPWGWTEDPFQQIVDQPDRRTFGGDNGGMIWDHSYATTTTAKFDIYSQISTIHGIKAGTEWSFTNMYVERAKYKSRSKEEVATLPPPSDWFDLEFNAYPVLGSFYVQDKIELEGMVANLGIRADYFSTNTMNYLVDPWSKYYGQQYQSVFYDSIPQNSVKGLMKWSPRVGLAFPISESAKLFFNYGHFYSYPMSSNLYGLQRGQNQVITKVGNPAVLMPKTVAYELGVELGLSDTYLLQITGYYKDVTEQLTSVKYVSTGSISYSSVQNQNIADIRGAEIRFEKRMGEWIRGWINFTYMSTNNGDIGRGSYYEEEERNIREGYLNYDASYRKPVPQPFARASVELFTPQRLGDFWGDWHLTLLPVWKSGSYYSYSPTGVDLPEFANNIHWPDYWNLDLRLAKYFTALRTDWCLYAEVLNVFNTKNFNPSTNYGFSDSYDRDAYLRSLHLPLYSGATYQAAGLTAGDDKVGELRSDAKPYINDPNLTHSLWGITRQINLGVRIML
jgi:outer membrane receptor protein involved in Fe transport